MTATLLSGMKNIRWNLLSKNAHIRQFYVAHKKPAATTYMCYNTQLQADEHSSKTDQHGKTSPGWVYGVVGSASLLLGAYLWQREKTALLAKTVDDLGGFKPELPTFSLAEVAKHKTKQTGIWVTYRNGVYDITKFVEEHPGGPDKITLAAGGRLEPYWSIYAIHKESEQAADMLSELRIGNITEVPPKDESDKNDPFVNDPSRSPLLIPSANKPFNAEPPQLLLIDQYNTPTDLFYVRNHLPVPTVDLKSFRLSVGVEGKRHGDITLDTLKSTRKFTKKVVSSTVQCAGNRRSEFNRFRQVKGNNWNASAIGNASWGGVTLRELLAYSRVDIFDDKYKHIQFDGLDKDLQGASYGASIPIEIARQRLDDIIIAYEMNGEPLSRDHGFPLRVVIPGVVGARQVKWLSKITLSTEESQSHWQQADYKGFNPSTAFKDLDYSKAVAISDLPVTSVICDPVAGTKIEKDADFIVCRGYAWSGGGRGIIRVDVSADGGETWHVADLDTGDQNAYKSWAWTLWEVAIPVDVKTQNFELICKATDVGYNVQPENVDGVWNVRGVLNNSWYRLKLGRL